MASGSIARGNQKSGRISPGDQNLFFQAMWDKIKDN